MIESSSSHQMLRKLATQYYDGTWYDKKLNKQQRGTDMPQQFH